MPKDKQKSPKSSYNLRSRKRKTIRETIKRDSSDSSSSEDSDYSSDDGQFMDEKNIPSSYLRCSHQNI